ncbi:hypothetical protein [Mycolicibacterium sp.]|uniref:hypothetical protein n=1 Tax=Mycolicibacterium sp. TaxID=2320850 RepID=UPI0037C7ACE5
MNHTEINCQAIDCRRLHVGDVVRVTYGPGQVGYGMLGTVVEQPGASRYTVHFPDGAPVLDADGEVLDMMDNLTYREAELEKA